MTNTALTLGDTLPTNVALVVASDLVGRSIVKQLAHRYRVVVVATGAEALAKVVRGRTFELVLCDLPIAVVLELHAAIATRSPSTAGRVARLAR